MLAQQDPPPSVKRAAPRPPRRADWAADPAIHSGLLLLRWLLIAAVGALSLTASGPDVSDRHAAALTLAFGGYSVFVTLAALRRPAPRLGPLGVAALDMLALTALTRQCGSIHCPLAFLYPVVIVTVLLHLPTLPGLLAVGGVVTAAALPVVTLPDWTWSEENLQLVGFDASLLLAVAAPVALLSRYLHGREDEMEQQRSVSARLHWLNEFMKAAAGAELDLDRAATTVAQVARDAVGGDAGLVFLRRDGGDGCEVWAAAHGPPTFAVSDLAATLPRVLDDDGGLVADAAAGKHHAVYEVSGLRSWVAARLTLNGQAAGLLLVGSRLPNSYRPAAREWLATIAAQAEQPLANARLHARERAYADKLGQLERTRTEFLLTASHELRTPLATLKIAAGLLTERMEASLEGQERAVLSSLVRNTDRLERLVDELLDMARLQSGALALKKEQVDIAAALEDAVVALRPLAGAKGQGLEVGPSAGRVLVIADRRRLDQVLVNLLGNACKYSPAGASIRASAQPHEGGVLLRVLDQAPGIPDEERDRIFEAFHRLGDHESDDPGGLGLGLAIVKGIVQLHGGRVWVERTSEGGNTFSVFLPQGDGAIEVDPRCTS